MYRTVRFMNDRYRDQRAPQGTVGTIADINEASYDVELMDGDTWVRGVPEGDLQLETGRIVMRAEVGAEHPL